MARMKHASACLRQHESLAGGALRVLLAAALGHRVSACDRHKGHARDMVVDPPTLINLGFEG
jgi:hypothetical protein